MSIQNIKKQSWNRHPLGKILLPARWKTVVNCKLNSCTICTVIVSSYVEAHPHQKQTSFWARPKSKLKLKTKPKPKLGDRETLKVLWAQGLAVNEAVKNIML